jgi:hypothetical protein
MDDEADNEAGANQKKRPCKDGLERIGIGDAGEPRIEVAERSPVKLFLHRRPEDVRDAEVEEIQAERDPEKEDGDAEGVGKSHGEVVSIK